MPSFKALSTFTGCGTTSGFAALSFQFPFGDHVTFAAVACQDSAGVCVCVCARTLCLERAIATFLALEFPIFSSLVFPWGSLGNTWFVSGAVEFLFLFVEFQGK